MNQKTNPNPTNPATPGEAMRYRRYEPARAPLKVFEIEGIRASVFRKKNRDEADGESVEYQVSFGRRYQKEGVWKTSSRLEPHEIPLALEVLYRTSRFLSQQIASPPASPAADAEIDALEVAAAQHPETV